MWHTRQNTTLLMFHREEQNRIEIFVVVVFFYYVDNDKEMVLVEINVSNEILFFVGSASLHI